MDKFSQKFADEFDNIYYGKDIDGFPVMPPPQFKEDVKEFVCKEIKRIMKRMKSVDKLVDTSKVFPHQATKREIYWYNEAIKKCRSILKNYFNL